MSVTVVTSVTSAVVSFVPTVMSGLYVSPTPRDNQPQIKRVPGFILISCVYDRSVVCET